MSIFKALIEKNTYRDSVLLMRISTKLRELPGIDKCEVMVGTVQNKKFLERGGLLFDEITEAGPSDLIIAISGDSIESVEHALKKGKELLSKPELLLGIETNHQHVFKSISEAKEKMPKANLAIISIPGIFVKREAMKALKLGLNLLIFSDNVPLEDELEIKKFAKEKELLVMGPDCGTAIINGKSLAFANKIRQGGIGIVGAAGTGIQEVASIVHNLGKGISHAIGTGSNDVRLPIGGITMIEGIRELENDPLTKVIAIVSKPPDEETLDSIVRMLKSCKKPTIVNFLGGNKDILEENRINYANTLEELALKSVRCLCGGDVEANLFAGDFKEDDLIGTANSEKNKFSKNQRYIRGLYTGGTLAIEACLLLREYTNNIFSNIPLKGCSPLNNNYVSKNNTILDMGADEFTIGKPHPMLEPEMRKDRIIQEARDRSTAVILLDFVLGYGIHPDPVGAVLTVLSEARRIAKEDNRHIAIVTSVCGTDEDPQNRSEQIRKLRDIGAIVLPTNAQAVKFARSICIN